MMQKVNHFVTRKPEEAFTPPPFIDGLVHDHTIVVHKRDTKSEWIYIVTQVYRRIG